ncbi:hypothetical protein NFE57_13415 [Hephaestia sp. MAHUQ-44]|nr:hypothetical protein [Hephaestia sp. MAHUQ-44]MCM8731962.1 hypothetical protein [Hephaestia sp. MAHUQ-44]
MGVLRQIEQRDSGFQITVVCGILTLDVAQAPITLLAPLVSQSMVEVRVDLAVEMIDVRRLNPGPQAIGLRLQPRDRFRSIANFIRVTFFQRTLDDSEHLIIEAKLADKGCEVLFQHFLTHIGFATFSLVARAVIIDVFLLLDLTHQRTAAVAAGDQAGEGEVVRAATHVGGVAAVENVLNRMPKLGRDERLVRSLIGAAPPVETAAIQARSKDLVGGPDANGRAALAISEASSASLSDDFFQRIASRRIPFVQLLHERAEVRVDHDDLLAVSADRVEVAEWCGAWPIPLLGLFDHAFADFFGKVVDVVFRHQHLDAVHELFGRTRFLGKDDPFLREMDLQIELVDRHPIFEVAVQPVGLLDENRVHGRVLLEVLEHGVETGAAALFRGFDVDKFFHDREAVERRVIGEKF